MAALTIRNLPDDVRDRLRVRAAQHGRSIEAEARAMLTEACAEPAKMSLAEVQQWVDRLYANKKPKRVVEDLIAERRREARRDERESRRK